MTIRKILPIAAFAALAVSTSGAAAATAGPRCTGFTPVVLSSPSDLCGCETVTRGFIRKVQRSPEFPQILDQVEAVCPALATVLTDTPTAAFTATTSLATPEGRGPVTRTSDGSAVVPGSGNGDGHEPTDGDDDGHEPTDGDDDGHEPSGGDDDGHGPSGGDDDGHGPTGGEDDGHDHADEGDDGHDHAHDDGHGPVIEQEPEDADRFEEQLKAS